MTQLTEVLSDYRLQDRLQDLSCHHRTILANQLTPTPFYGLSGVKHPNKA